MDGLPNDGLPPPLEVFHKARRNEIKVIIRKGRFVFQASFFRVYYVKTLGGGIILFCEGHLVISQFAGLPMRPWAVHLFGSASSSRIRPRKQQIRWRWSWMQAFLQRHIGITCHGLKKKTCGVEKKLQSNPARRRKLGWLTWSYFFTGVFFV